MNRFQILRGEELPPFPKPVIMPDGDPENRIFIKFEGYEESIKGQLLNIYVASSPMHGGLDGMPWIMKIDEIIFVGHIGTYPMKISITGTITKDLI